MDDVMTIMEHRTLLLNSTWEPLRVVSWQRAVILWFEEKVEILEEYDDFDLTSMTISMKCPSVIRLYEFVNGKKHRVKFSRINVFARDKYTCQYCNGRPGTSSLTYDHVIPRSRGGKTVWDNIATCCIKCNSKKADRTPAEARMTLMSKPTKPAWSPRQKLVVALPKTPDSWRSYIYWNQELESDNED